jgi:hypothetical protein
LHGSINNITICQYQGINTDQEKLKLKNKNRGRDLNLYKNPQKLYILTVKGNNS